MTREEKMRFIELQKTCEGLKSVVDEQAKAIMKYTEVINTISYARQKRDIVFDDETYTSFVKFDGGLILFR